MFNKAYMLIVGTVLLYYIADLTNMRYGTRGNDFISDSAGKLTKRLNFALAERNILSRSNNPYYNTITASSKFSDSSYVNP